MSMAFPFSFVSPTLCIGLNHKNQPGVVLFTLQRFAGATQKNTRVRQKYKNTRLACVCVCLPLAEQHSARSIKNKEKKQDIYIYMYVHTYIYIKHVHRSYQRIVSEKRPPPKARLGIFNKRNKTKHNETKEELEVRLKRKRNCIPRASTETTRF